MKIIIDFAVIIIFYVFIFYKKWKKSGRDKLLVNTTMYIYLSFVLYFTLMPIIAYLPNTLYHLIFNHHYKSMNFVPFIDVLNGRGDFLRQIILNVIMTIPFGVLCPIINRNAKLLKTVLYTFLLSLSIELLQLIISGTRSSDITDIITNVIGGIIGYIAYLIFKPLIFKILDFIKDK